MSVGHNSTSITSISTTVDKDDSEISFGTQRKSSQFGGSLLPMPGATSQTNTLPNSTTHAASKMLGPITVVSQQGVLASGHQKLTTGNTSNKNSKTVGAVDCSDTTSRLGNHLAPRQRSLPQVGRSLCSRPGNNQVRFTDWARFASVERTEEITTTLSQFTRETTS